MLAPHPIVYGCGLHNNQSRHLRHHDAQQAFRPQLSAIQGVSSVPGPGQFEQPDVGLYILACIRSAATVLLMETPLSFALGSHCPGTCGSGRARAAASGSMPKRPRDALFPTGRIKRIMQQDEVLARRACAPSLCSAPSVRAFRPSSPHLSDRRPTLVVGRRWARSPRRPRC